MRANPSRLQVTILGWLIIPVAWLGARPYYGVRHDGILYLGQALRHIWPDNFAKDIFFAFGSQDSYSVFPALSAHLFEWMGVAAVESMLPLVAQSGLLLTALWLVRIDSKFSRFESWLALLALAAFPHLYDGLSLLAFAEPFLTARTLAEPLALLAVCFLLTQRWLACGLAIGCAAMVHPLLALPVIVVGWVYLCLMDRRWLWAACFALMPLALAKAGVMPFDKLAMTYDAQWWASVEQKNAIVLLSMWELPGIQNAVLDLCLLALAHSMIGGRLGRLYRATLIAAPLLLAVSGIGADLLHNVLITSIQIWRVMWFVHMLALLALPVLILRLRAQEPHGPLVASALFLAAVATHWSAGWALELWAAFAMFVHWRKFPVSSRIERVAIASNVVGTIAICAVIGQMGAQFASNAEGATVLSVTMTFLTTPVCVIAGALMLFWIVHQHSWIHWLAIPVLVAAGCVSVLNWDRRDDWQRFVESTLNTPHPFQREIEKHQQVYWHDQLQANWLMLKRPSYFSEIQAGGQLFNRGTMEEMSRRSPEFKGLRMQSNICSMMAHLNGVADDRDCSPTPELAEEICKKNPGLDFMVFEARLPRGLVDTWTFNPPSGRKPTTYYLYACNKLRSS